MAAKQRKLLHKKWSAEELFEAVCREYWRRINKNSYKRRTYSSLAKQAGANSMRDFMHESYDDTFCLQARGDNRSIWNLGDGCRRIYPHRRY